MGRRRVHQLVDGGRVRREAVSVSLMVVVGGRDVCARLVGVVGGHLAQPRQHRRRHLRRQPPHEYAPVAWNEIGTTFRFPNVPFLT